MNGPPEPHPPLRAYVALVAMTVAFGGTFVATKVALRGFEPLLIALVRFTVAGGGVGVARRTACASAS